MIDRFKSIKLNTLLLTGSSLVYVAACIGIVFMIYHSIQRLALEEAERKALILLNRNLAVHAYFSHQLKPGLFKFTDPFLSKDYFDPTWMSSTYAVREIDKYSRSLSEEEYYYKECSVDARSPQNEADAYERAFLEEMNRNRDLIKRTEVRIFDGNPYFVVLRKGEVMEESCLRCHSTAEKAPDDLVAKYGTEKSFNREAGDIVSVISIRLPLSAAYSSVKAFTANMSWLAVCILFALFGIQFWLHERMLLSPLSMIRKKSIEISNNPDRLGEEIPVPLSLELRDLVLSFNSMSVALRRHRDHLEEQIEERTKELALMFDSVPALIFYKDLHNRIVRANRTWFETLGLREDMVIGKPLYEFFPEGLADNLFKDEMEVMRTGRPSRGIVEEIKTENGIRWFITDKIPHKDGGGNTVGIIGFSADITEQKISREQLIEAKETAEAANRAKSEFLANMSHEIRTPISGIMGMTDMALMLNPSEEQRGCLSLIKTAANSLLGIINDLLDISKIEAGKMEMQEERFDLGSLLSSTVKTLGVQAEENGLELSYRIGPNVPPMLTGDCGKLSQVLRNLIGNALKFTERGEVKVEVERIEGEEKIVDSKPQVKLIFSVSDTGIGIPEAEQKSIFDAFKQIDSSPSKKYGGTGLGLAISKYIVEMLGGEIWLESEEGRGATFYFTAMFQEAGITPDALVEPTEATVQAPTDARSLMILLAEDNPINRKFLTHWLEKTGHVVVAAENGRKALETFEKNSFDLVLMDIQMPEMDGIEATRIIRGSKSESVNASIPIIALTAYAMKGDRESFLEAGMNDYVSKPVIFEELLHAIDRAVRKEQRVRTSHPQVTAGIESIDMERFRARYKDNKGILDELVNDFRQALPEKIESLKHSLKANDLETASKIAHNLVGSVGLFLATKSVRFARELEEAARNGDAVKALSLLPKLDKELHVLIEILEGEMMNDEPLTRHTSFRRGK